MGGEAMKDYWGVIALGALVVVVFALLIFAFAMGIFGNWLHTK
jgi:hypothetical protein